MDVMELRRGLMMMQTNSNATWKLINQYATNLNSLFLKASLPEIVEVDLSGFDSLTGLDRMFMHTSGVKTLRIKNFRSTLTDITMNDFAYRAGSVTNIEFIDCDFAPKNFTEAFLTANHCTTISGEIDFSNATNVNSIFSDCPRLVDVRFKQNTLKISMLHIHQSPLLSDASLVSIANGLNASVTGQSIRFHDTPKARLSTLMGNNVGGTFIADEQGAISLESFITTVKGWTLA